MCFPAIFLCCTRTLFGAYLNSITDVENGDTLHVVERQPQPSSGPNTGELRLHSRLY